MEQRKIFQYALGKVLNKTISFYGWNGDFYGNNVYVNNEKITLSEKQANAWKKLTQEDIKKELEQNRIVLNISYDEYKKFSREDANTLKDLGHFDSIEKKWFSDNKENYNVLVKLSDKYREEQKTQDKHIGNMFGKKGDFIGDLMVMEKPNGDRYTIEL